MCKPAFSRAIPVLPVRDIAAAIEWYARLLEMETVYLHEGDEPGEATNYAVLIRDDVVFHLILDEPPPHSRVWTQAGCGYLYLLVGNVEEVYANVQSRGATITRELQRENWGACGFDLTDPSGNTVHIEQP